MLAYMFQHTRTDDTTKTETVKSTSKLVPASEDDSIDKANKSKKDLKGRGVKCCTLMMF